MDYDVRWPMMFEAEADRIRNAVGPAPEFTLQHFGSTAIPGLVAKPIIDIMVICDHRDRWPPLREPLEGLGYVYWAENPRCDRMFFVKGMPPLGERRTHHVHVRTSSDARSAILFRDYLRSHPDEARRYAALKHRLAAQHATDRDAYSEAKQRYVEDVVAKANASP